MLLISLVVIDDAIDGVGTDTGASIVIVGTCMVAVVAFVEVLLQVQVSLLVLL